MQTDRQTDTTEIIYQAASRVIKKLNECSLTKIFSNSTVYTDFVRVKIALTPV